MRESREHERRVGDSSLLEELFSSLEGRDDGFDRLAVSDHVVRRDRRERIGDVVWEIVAAPQRLGEVTGLGPAT